MSFGRVFSTGNLSLIRVPQYWINGVKGGCKGLEYSKMLKIPLCLSTGMASETLIYHNACNRQKTARPTEAKLLSKRSVFSTISKEKAPTILRKLKPSLKNPQVNPGISQDSIKSICLKV